MRQPHLRFFLKAILHHGESGVVTIDKSGANTARRRWPHSDAGKEKDESMSKYLNNLIEQDQWNIKRKICLMPGFKSFRHAQVILTGIEQVRRYARGNISIRTRTGYPRQNRFI